MPLLTQLEPSQHRFIVDKLRRTNRTIKLKDFEKLANLLATAHNVSYNLKTGRNRSCTLQIDGFGVQTIHLSHQSSVLNSHTLIDFRRVFKQALINIDVFDKL